MMKMQVMVWVIHDAALFSVKCEGKGPLEGPRAHRPDNYEKSAL
jgi:hypothetical protein